MLICATTSDLPTQLANISEWIDFHETPCIIVNIGIGAKKIPNRNSPVEICVVKSKWVISETLHLFTGCWSDGVVGRWHWLSDVAFAHDVRMLAVEKPPEKTLQTCDRLARLGIVKTVITVMNTRLDTADRRYQSFLCNHICYGTWSVNQWCAVIRRLLLSLLL